MATHALEDQAEGSELGEPLAECRIEVQARSCYSAAAVDRRVWIPRPGAPDPPETIWRGGDECFEDFLYCATELQVRIPDNPCGYPRTAVEARCRHRCHAVDEFNLAHWLQRRRTLCAVHRGTVDENGRYDGVPGLQVALDLVHEIARFDPPFATIPQMVVGIADGEIGLQRLLLDLFEPFVVRCHRSSVFSVSFNGPLCTRAAA